MNKEYIVITILPNTTKKEQELINSSLAEYLSEGFKIEDKIVSPFLVIIILINKRLSIKESKNNG